MVSTILRDRIKEGMKAAPPLLTALRGENKRRTVEIFFFQLSVFMYIQLIANMLNKCLGAKANKKSNIILLVAI